MAPNSRKSILLVAVQFLALGVLFVTGPVVARNPLFLALETAGAFLFFWALWQMRHKLPNVLPDVRAGATLVATGPYRWIRHPMYTSLLLIAGALVLDEPSPLRLAALLLLASDLVIKLRYEERLLAASFPGYADYQQRTHRLIPYVY